MAITFSSFAANVQGETAFTVLAAAKRLIAQGKNVIELEIGDSPFPTSPAALAAGIAALEAGETRYGPSLGLPEFREAAAAYVNREYGLSADAENIVAGPGAKIFETFFCEAFVNPGDGVLIFSPHFPTYPANVQRRGGRILTSKLRASHDFRPDLDDVARFLAEDPRPRAIFLNSPHNPTGGVATLDDLEELGRLIRGRDVAVFSDEPYDAMVWRGRHHSLLAQPGMFDQCVAAYTFSKSFSMSGWRLGFAVGSAAAIDVFGLLANTSLSCVPPFAQRAGMAAMAQDASVRDERMARFRRKVELLAEGLNRIEGVVCLSPGGTFYVFPSVATICNRHGITSHGLAQYLLAGADDATGVACLGGECFGEAGGGFLRLSCAEPDERLSEAVAFIGEAIRHTARLSAWIERHPDQRLRDPYPDD